MNYELVYILTPKLSDNDAEKKAKEFNQQIKDDAEEITLEDFWGKKELAYPINKLEHGYYMLVQFKAKKESVKNIDKKIKLDEEIIRYLIVKKDEFVPKKQDKSEEKVEPEDEKGDTEIQEDKSEVTTEEVIEKKKEAKEEAVEEQEKETTKDTKDTEVQKDKVKPKKEKKVKADISDLDKKLDDILDSDIDD